MAEANAAEPNERAAPSPRRPRRNHVINLCCAQSVHRVVEEVARNLEGLGFRTTVVTGAEARAALLGSATDSEQPTIHVVCVQGSMQERVLKPLRQALATHGGPNHHLFVAVLDLAVPLAMVGQIRRFAEALERPASGSHAAAVASDLEQSPTRSYPSVAQVVERGGTKPPIAPDGDEAGDRQSRRGRPRVAKIAPTSKYQAVTASHPAIAAEPGVRKRRRERSRLSPSARRRPSEARVLGLPEQEETRQPLAARREQPPPPPAPGELVRRRSSTTIPPVAAPPVAAPPLAAPPLAAPPLAIPPLVSALPPLTKTPSSTSLPAMGGAATPEGLSEPDRVMPRNDAGFRFSPPGVKAADGRRPVSGPLPAASPGEGLRDPDKTRVESVLAEVPRTASTLRLDEPPFGDGSKPRRERSEASRDEDPVEPTMIIASPRGPAIEIDEEELEEVPAEATVVGPPRVPRRAGAQPVSPTSIGATPLPPAATGTTVVGPPPKPTPEVLAELERVQRELGVSSQPPAAGPRKTFGYIQRGERAEAAAARPGSPEDERAKTLVSESSRTLVHGPDASSESSGTLVLRPRSAVTVDEEELLPDSSSTLVLRPRAGAPQPSSEASGTVVQPAPTAATPVSESEKTLLRSDGKFETSREVMQKIEASRRAQAEAEPADAGPSPAPSDAQQGAFKAGKTVLYADSAAVPLPAEPTHDGTVVTPKPAAAPSSKPDATVVAPPPAAPPKATPRESEPDAPVIAARPLGGHKPRPSSVPTERHPMAEAEPSRRSRGKKRSVPARPEPPQSARAGVLEAPSPHPRSAAPRPRAKARGSRYGWLWIMLALLTAGGGWGAYQAGLLDGLLGRRSGGPAVADAGAERPEPPTPSDPTPRTSAGEAGAGEAGAGEAGAGEAGVAEGAAAEAGSAEAGSASTGPDAADSAQPAADATSKAESGDESTSTGDAPDATTGEPEPAAGSTGSPEPADDGKPEEPTTTGAPPEEPTTDGPRLSPEEQMLAAAVEQRRIFMLKTLYATRRQGEETSFAGAWARCAKLEVDGVKRWRLPHRREMKLVNAVLNLPGGVYWTRTVPPEDKSSAYVLDTADASLSLFLKEEPNGDVVCVREREHPDE